MHFSWAGSGGFYRLDLRTPNPKELALLKGLSMNSRAGGFWVGVAVVLFSACGETPSSVCKEENPTTVLRSFSALQLPQSSSAVGIWSFENDSDDFLGQSNATSSGVEFQRFG